MKNFRKCNVMLMVVVMVLTLVIPLGNGRVQAESSNKFTLRMTVKNGMASIIINNNKEYQLTESNTVEDGGFSDDCTLWLLLKNNWLLWYNYQYEGDSKIGLHALDNQVEKLTRNAEGHIDGYVSKNEKKNLLTENQIKDIVEYGESKFAIPVKIEEGIPTTEPTSTVAATETPKPTTTIKPTATAVTIPTIKPTATATATLKPVVTPIRNQYRISYQESNGKTMVTLNGVEYEVTEKYVTEEIGFDNNGTLILLTKNTEGGMLLWYSPLYQKDIQFYVLESNVKALVKENKKVVGYVSENGSEKKLPTEEEIIKCIQGLLPQIRELPIKAKIGATSEPQKTVEPVKTLEPRKTVSPTVEPKETIIPNRTASPTVKPTVTIKPTTKPFVYAYAVVTKGTKKVLNTSEDEEVDALNLTPRGKLKYKDLKINSVKFAEFNAKGNIVIIRNRGSFEVINHLTLKRKVIERKNVKKFIYTSKGIAKYAVRKNGKKIKLDSY